jgi:hypothetical protein
MIGNYYRISCQHGLQKCQGIDHAADKILGARNRHTFQGATRARVGDNSASTRRSVGELKVVGEGMKERKDEEDRVRFHLLSGDEISENLPLIPPPASNLERE